MDEIATLRRFNRSYTQRIGVLSESYLGAGRPLGPSRLLFEVGATGARVSELRRRLGLDSGYLSRLLRQLEQDDLITVTPDPIDRRQRMVALSAAGRREWRRLDRRSEDVARRIVDPLTTRQREDLAVALATAERLLRAATATFEHIDPRAPAAGEALAQYFGELDARFPTGFDVGAAGGEDLAALGPPDGAFVLVATDATTIGCGAVQRIDDRTADIKRMWIHPDWRGLGLGARLLVHLEDTARGLGRTRAVLDTNATLREAISMYERGGYHAIERYNDNPYAQRWFAKEL